LITPNNPNLVEGTSSNLAAIESPQGWSPAPGGSLISYCRNMLQQHAAAASPIRDVRSGRRSLVLFGRSDWDELDLFAAELDFELVAGL